MNKLKEEQEIPAVVEKSQPKKERVPSRNFFSLLLSNEWLSKESAANMLPFFLFLTLIGMFYIGNRHFAEKHVREIEKLNKELKELRWEYMTTKAELMFRSKQTEVAKQTELFGLKESVIPPKKIVVIEK